MEKNKKISRLLWGTIAALVFFNGYQLSGIFFGSVPVSKPVPQKQLTDTSAAHVQINVLNGCGVAGVGNTMTVFCRGLGYDVVEMGNYKSFDVRYSVVIDRSGKPEAAKHLARQIGISAKNVIVQFSNDHLVAASVVIGKDYKNLNPWIK
jgi:hypothetical protein